jgi:hypothetical protein
MMVMSFVVVSNQEKNLIKYNPCFSHNKTCCLLGCVKLPVTNFVISDQVKPLFSTKRNVKGRRHCL